MRLGWSKTKYSISYYAQKTVYVNGKNKSQIVKRYGSEKYICQTYGVSDAKAWMIFPCPDSRRWQIEECFRIMKTDFEARPVYVKRKDRILAHFITCFIALIVYRYLEQKLDNKYTIDQILSTLKEMDFVKYEGFSPCYVRKTIKKYCREELYPQNPTFFHGSTCYSVFYYASAFPNALQFSTASSSGSS